MPVPAVLQRLRRNVAGIASVEFAVVLPVLLSLYLVGNTLSDAIACNRKVTTTARAIADLTSRYPSVSTADAQIILNASSQIMWPYNANNGTFRVSEIMVTDATHAQVMWSQTRAGGTALTTGSSILIPNAMSAVGSYMIIGEASYPYTPVVTWGNVASVNLNDIIYMSPRLSDQVPLQ